MRIRTDSVLHTLLRELHERAQGPIADHLGDALDLMGTRSTYRGGRRLLDQLDFIAREADGVDDHLMAKAVRDAVAYATGRLLTADLEATYQLDDGSGDDLRFLEKVTSGMAAFAAQEVDVFLQEHPGASATDVRDHLDALGERALRFVKARRAGHYGAFRIRGDAMAWTTDVLVDRVAVLPSRSADPRVDAVLAEPDSAHLLAAAQIALRHGELDEIEHVVQNAFSKERHLQRAVQGSPWIFGGGFDALGEVRRLVSGAEVDLPLLRPDGVLHVVELKLANVQTVKRHRAKLVPTAAVHDAVAQVMTYLREFDEQRDHIRDRYAIEVRRAAGTVVIGHPDFEMGVDERAAAEAIRVYTSHLSRIDVLSYKQLVDSARRSLVVASGAWGEVGQLGG
jgi:hypothetical protein